MIFYLLYIDPGTGSALFSIAIGIAAAVYFLSRAFILKLKVIIFRKKDENQSQNKYIIYAEDKRYWTLFKPILDEIEIRGIDVLYLTSSIDDPVFSSGYSFVKVKYIGQGNKALAYINFLSADFVLTTTPELDVLQWKRSKTVKHYCHYIHGAGGTLLYRLFSLDFFDSVLVPGEIEIPEIRSLEKTRNIPEKQLVVVGNTFFDLCYEKIKYLPAEQDHKFTVLVAPSWGVSSLLQVYGDKLIEPLAKKGWRIILRPHPQSSIVEAEKKKLEKLTALYADNPNIEWDYSHDNIHVLAKSDVMISDFSGIIYDYVFLFNRPVIVNTQELDFRRLDAGSVNELPYYFDCFKKIGIELDGSKIDSIADTINAMVQDTELSEQLRKNRIKAKDMMWQYRNEAGKRVVDFMIKTANGGFELC